MPHAAPKRTAWNTPDESPVKGIDQEVFHLLHIFCKELRRRMEECKI